MKKFAELKHYINCFIHKMIHHFVWYCWVTTTRITHMWREFLFETYWWTKNLKTPKIKNLKNEKICRKYHHFTHVYQKSQSCDVWFLRYRVRQKDFLSFWAIFFRFTHPTNDLKNQTYEKKIIKWDNHYDVWFLRYGAWQTKLFVFLDRFLPFYPSSNPKNQNFEKMKNKSGDIIILHMCTISDNHIMYGSWDMECDGENFLSFWTVFCPFNPLTTRKIKILKKWKKYLEILLFYKGVP